jgi:hypothetical protein
MLEYELVQRPKDLEDLLFQGIATLDDVREDLIKCSAAAINYISFSSIAVPIIVLEDTGQVEPISLDGLKEVVRKSSNLAATASGEIGPLVDECISQACAWSDTARMGLTWGTASHHHIAAFNLMKLIEPHINECQINAFRDAFKKVVVPLNPNDIWPVEKPTQFTRDHLAKCFSAFEYLPDHQ